MDAHLRDLRYFVAVAEELSFTRAAQRLHVSQPALSKQIAALETTLRAPLLRRDRRQVSLTAAGAALHAAARDLLADWDDAAAAVADAAAAEARVLRVGTQTSLGRELYPAVLDLYAKQQPDWRVELQSVGWGDPTAGLADHTCDVSFLWLPAGSTDLDARVLVTEPRSVALSSRHRLAGRAAVDFAEISDEPFAALPESAGAARDFWLATAHRAGQPTRIAAEVSSADEVFELVAAGVAVKLIAGGNAAIYARAGITCVPVRGVEPARLAIAWRRGDQRASVTAFAEACAQAAADAGIGNG